MKLVSAAIMIGAAVFITLSCGTVDKAKKYPDMAADAAPIAAGIIEAEFDRLFSSKLSKAAVA